MVLAVLPGTDIGRSIWERKSPLPHPDSKIKGPYIPGAIRPCDRSRSVGEAIAVEPHIVTAIWKFKRALSLPGNSDDKGSSIGVSVFQRPGTLSIGPSVQSLTLVRTPPKRQCHLFCKTQWHKSEYPSQEEINPKGTHAPILLPQRSSQSRGFGGEVELSTILSV